METIIYTDPSSHLEIPDVVFSEDAIWMSQLQISKLYDYAIVGMTSPKK